jgi:hypothetical protein
MSSIREVRRFSIPQHETLVEIISFLATIRATTRSSRTLDKSGSYYYGALTRLSVNQKMIDLMIARVPDLRVWKSNAHRIAVSLLHHRFHLDESVPDNHIAIDYVVRKIEDDVILYPGRLTSSGTGDTHGRGAASIDRHLGA